MTDYATGLPTRWDFDPLPTHEAYQDLELRAERAEEAVRRFGEDRGWDPLTTYTDTPSHAVLLDRANQVRAMSTAHPLMVRGKSVRAAYVFGEGVSINVTRDGDDHITAVARGFVDDTGNQAAWFGHTAGLAREADMFDDGNVFAGHWVDRRTGDVKVRPIPFTEIVDIRTAPGDYTTNCYYLRRWTVKGDNGATHTHEAWLPDLDFDPVAKPRVIDSIPVLWPGTTHPVLGNGCAVKQVRDNVEGRTGVFGVGDGYSALNWARRHSDFLSDTAHLYTSLAKIAHVFSGSKNRAQMGRSVAQAMAGGPGGAMYGDQLNVSTPSFSGIDPKMGRPYAAMVAAALGLPVTILTADPGQEGARAVAETLDRPMRLAFQARQRLWADAYRASIMFKLRQAAQAPSNPFRCKIEQVGDRKILDFGDTPPVIDIVFPDIQEDNVPMIVDALAKAHATGTVPPEVTMSALLRILEVEDADQVIEKYTDDDGNWVDPALSALDAAGLAAMNRARQGEELT